MHFLEVGLCIQRMSKLDGEKIFDRAVPVDKDVVESKLEDEDLKLLLHLQIRLIGFLPGKNVE